MTNVQQVSKRGRVSEELSKESYAEEQVSFNAGNLAAAVCAKEEVPTAYAMDGNFHGRYQTSF